MVPDDPCPEGFHYYRGTCFLPAKEQMTFENAQVRWFTSEKREQTQLKIRFIF